MAEFRALLVFTNRFSLGGSEPAPEDGARLLSAELVLSDPGELRALAERVAATGYPHELSAETLTVRDPSSDVLRFS
ncbi:hypothetical protein Ahu01nite_092190 [Winogradskya humida]|uniref:Uncharacterized protein n=1 Tax=Winogradskya humida TaxID=113566 RepID=A0ABQ4A5I9_9ACTN|nr:hypothetical protein Ahu01nite_092190 [Actinoplanes humidus]